MKEINLLMTGLFDDNSVNVFVSVELHLLAWREGEVDVDLRPDENENERERDATEGHSQASYPPTQSILI